MLTEMPRVACCFRRWLPVVNRSFSDPCNMRRKFAMSNVSCISSLRMSRAETDVLVGRARPLSGGGATSAGLTVGITTWVEPVLLVVLPALSVRLLPAVVPVLTVVLLPEVDDVPGLVPVLMVEPVVVVRAVLPVLPLERI